MKRLIFLFHIVFFLRTISTAQETIHLTNGEWPPYFSKDLKDYGIGSRVITEAFALEGVKVEYGFFPWRRSLMLAEKGEWDGAVGWEINSERQKKFYSSNKVWEAPWVFFHLKSKKLDWKTLDDLKDLHIGGTLEYMYTVEFQKAERSGKIKVDRAASDGLNFRKLLNGRIDIFPQLIDVGYYQLNKLFDRKTVILFTNHNRPLGKHTEYLLLTRKHKKNEKLIIVFNKGLQKLKDSGKYDAYFNELRSGKYNRSFRN
ncbi:MAG: transporter substrate-binding domain-containing protein [Spirochaetes bacterium]|nr:transporter substrate-binding domain-containing protein [Spirochaetota bacterium]